MNRIALCAAALAVAACSTARPAAGPTVDAGRLLRHVESLAADSMQGRRTATPGAARARAYLLGELRRIGVDPVGTAFEHPFHFVSRRDSSTVSGVNLLARIPGTRTPDSYLVVTAHYDHVGIGTPVGGDSIYNGADDNASGTAALLEVAEHFRRNPPPVTLILGFLDAEEMGLQGARAFVQNPPVPAGAILLNVNLDMVGHSERGELYAAGTSHSPFLRPILEPVVARAPIRLLFGHDTPVPSPSDDWTSQSDQGAFHRAGIPFVYFGVEDHPDYHKPSDEPRTLTPDFFVGATRTILDAIDALTRAAPEIARARAAARPISVDAGLTTP